MLALIIVGLSALAALVLYYNFYHKRKDLPWGPTPLPVLGNLLSLMANPPGEKVYLRWRKEYGPVYSEFH